ncbi:arsenite methyltransferase isoform X2 [Tiliqua scincoides]|uniref:arsenite methyltransferase isoform X2 n=1 Tax=Tiliqua scincoides TaxID=71010 RepID=UPI0034626934
MSEQIYKEVQDYYGKELKKTEDLKTNACITAARPLPIFVREALQCVHEEVSAKYYGCGLVIPECIEGCWVLDLGSGSGRDCYVLSKLVGENGHVTGVDMTETQDASMSFFNLLSSSNCVVNLSPDKRTVLREAFRMLKAGGELYFSDVYASHDLSEDIRKHRVLWGECLGGALWWKDLYKIADEVGFSPPRLVTASRITLANKELESIVGDCQFVSATFRLFKIPKDGSIQQCEIIYKGGIAGHEKEFAFDVNYNFKQGEVVEVDGETASVLRHSRFAKKFLISPVEQKLPACEGHSPGTIKEKIADPFKLVEQTEAKVSAKSPSGCFGPKRCC